MTSNQQSFSELHTCWLMSPGGTDSMQISNWKRITQIHHCISAHTVATVHSKYTKRQRKMEEMCSRWFGRRCWSGISDEWDTNAGLQSEEQKRLGCSPRCTCCLLHPSSLISLLPSQATISSLPGDLPGAKGKKRFPKKTDTHLSSLYCHRAYVFRNQVINQSLNLEPGYEADKCDTWTRAASVSGKGATLLLLRCLTAPNTWSARCLSPGLFKHWLHSSFSWRERVGGFGVAPDNCCCEDWSPVTRPSLPVGSWDQQTLAVRGVNHSKSIWICCYVHVPNASKRILLMLPWKSDF